MEYGCQSMFGKIERILIKKPEAAFLSQEHLDRSWERFRYMGCPDYQNVNKEFAEFEGLIRRFVPDVRYLPEESEVGIDSIYTHDAVKVTARGAIYFSMGKGLRRSEPEATRGYLERIGVETLGQITGKGRMEGGDVVWLDKRTVAIGLGYRTNQEGIRQFREFTETFVDDVVVVPLPHADGPDACLHLMSLISIVDRDLAVVYLKYMPVFFKELLLKRGFRLIEVPDQEYLNLGSNVLALGPGKCLMLSGNPVTRGLLEQAGAEVFEYPGLDLSLKGTGGPTCLTQPLLRR